MTHRTLTDFTPNAGNQEEPAQKFPRFSYDRAVVQIRDYNRNKVTNKFVVGAWIEWVEEYLLDTNENLVSVYCTGLIKKITPGTIILEINGKDRCVGKAPFIHENIRDFDLYESINASIGQNPPKETAKDKVLHDVYRLRDPRNKSIFYVGLSKNSQRRYRQHLACAGLNFKLNLRIQEILQSGLVPEMEIIEQAIPGSAKARERERFWINHHIQAGDLLTNIAEMDEVE